jgi:hypothetical protein
MTCKTCNDTGVIWHPEKDTDTFAAYSICTKCNAFLVNTLRYYHQNEKMHQDHINRAEML